jgi:hypothetical protein
MTPYQSKSPKIKGDRYKEVRDQALILFGQIQKKTKRRAYVRSSYFTKQKIFFDYFWKHLSQKPPKERFRRLKYFKAAVELVRNSKDPPLTIQNPNKSNEVLHRFAGLTQEKELFYVQIKENKRTGKKDFMSCFPA